MTPSERILNSFTFGDLPMPPDDAAYEVSVGEIEATVLLNWIGSSVMMMVNARAGIDSGESTDQDFIDYVETWGSEQGLRIATSALAKVAATTRSPVLTTSELCNMAVLAAIRAWARPPGEEITQLLVGFFTRMRERLVDDAKLRVEL